MFKKLLSNKIRLIEGLILVIPLIWFSITKVRNEFVASELTINLTFLALFVTLFIFRSSNHRHLYFAFAFLILMVLGTIFGFDNLAFLSGSLTISLLILGTLNMLIFGSGE